MQTAPIAGYKNAEYPAGDVTQWFGENPARYGKICYAHKPFGARPYCMVGHNGIDIVRAWGTPLRAVQDGVIGDVKYSAEGYGKHVRLFADGPDGFVNEWTYGHCSSIAVKIGQKVRAGDVIAYMGNTGFVVSGATPFWKHNPYAGTHLHLGLRRHKRWFSIEDGQYTLAVGPYKMVEIHNYENGFFGSIDFSAELAEAADAVDTPQQSQLRLTLGSLYNQFGLAYSRTMRRRV